METIELQSLRFATEPEEQAKAQNVRRAPLGQVQYRNWCRSRVETRDTDQVHRRVPDEERDKDTELLANVEKAKSRGSKSLVVGIGQQDPDIRRKVRQLARRGVAQAMLARALMNAREAMVPQRAFQPGMCTRQHSRVHCPITSCTVLPMN